MSGGFLQEGQERLLLVTRLLMHRQLRHEKVVYTSVVIDEQREMGVTNNEDNFRYVCWAIVS